MADLQAATAAKNLLSDKQGRSAQHTFRAELICIVDTLDKGILVYRTPKRARLLDKTLALHWSKRLFEWLYLRAYR